MPKPENIRRIVTGPKSANRSIRKSRSMAPLHRNLAQPIPMRHCGEGVSMAPSRRPSRRQLHRFAATAGAGLVRVVEDELRLHLVGLVVHLGAEQEQHGLGIDQDLDALVLDHFVGRADLVGVFDRVGLPGAAAVLDPDAKPTISESARLVSSVIRCAAASVSFMTCGRGRGFGLAAGAGEAGVMSVMWSIPAANQCRSFSMNS